MIYLLWNANPRELAASLRAASWPILAASAAALGCFYLLRAMRWFIILRIRVPVVPLFLYSSLGYLASSIMPLQAGELIKPGLLRLRHRIQFLEGLSSVGVERVLDVFGLVILGSMSLLVLPTSLDCQGWLAESLRTAGILSSTIIVILFLAVFFAPRWGRVAAAVFNRLPIPAGMKTGAAGFVHGMIQGAAVIKAPILFTLAILITLLLWGVNYLSVLLVFNSVGITAQPMIVLLGFAVLSLGVALPLTPAAIGQYETLWVLVFLALGVKPEASVVATGVLSHALIILVILVFGLFSMMLLPRSILRDARIVAASERENFSHE